MKENIHTYYTTVGYDIAVILIALIMKFYLYLMNMTRGKFFSSETNKSSQGHKVFSLKSLNSTMSNKNFYKICSIKLYAHYYTSYDTLLDVTDLLVMVT